MNTDITIGSDICSALDLGAHVARSADADQTLITRHGVDLYLTGEGGSELTDAQWQAVQPAIAAELERIVEEERVGALAYDREEREVASVEPLRIADAKKAA